MGRSAKFDSDAILDSALALIAESGPAAATIAAIAKHLDAPTGSIYHRFASRELILAELWLRGIARFQPGLIAALDSDDAEAAALHSVAWCRANLTEATVLMLYRREDLARGWPMELGEQLRNLNAAAEHAYDAFLARHPRIGRNQLDFVVFDLPLGAVRRHLAHRRPPPAWVDEVVRTALKAVLEEPK